MTDPPWGAASGSPHAAHRSEWLDRRATEQCDQHAAVWAAFAACMGNANTFDRKRADICKGQNAENLLKEGTSDGSKERNQRLKIQDTNADKKN
jgi:hypothetical protein